MNKSTFAGGLFYFGSAVTFAVLVFLILFILINGVPHLTPSLCSWDYTTANVSLMPALITTLYVIGGSLLIATPIGIFTAIYLVEYADRTKFIVKLISMATDTLRSEERRVGKERRYRWGRWC